MSFKDKTIIISGGSRGIGLAIAKSVAKDGANVVLAAKTSEPHSILPGTVFSAAEEVESVGGTALPIVCDVREEEQINNVVTETLKQFKKIDALILNASALAPQGTLDIPTKKFDLMSDINQRGTFLMGRACIPHLIKSDNPHILTISPPINFADHWWGKYLPWTMMKYSMSLCVLAWSQEFSKSGLAANALWPKTVISTAATKMLGEEVFKKSRKPEIMGDAAYWILSQQSQSCNGNYFLDETVLKNNGITDFDVYANDPSTPPLKDWLVDD
ncbi:MAG: short chain dehydrogenase [Gammaproteobacteria bacterium]|nr:short chain dehydrogenase [Gammaproteobacteria bacterium]